MGHIKNKIIVITAGASGIGADMAKSLSKAGAAVIIGDKDEIALKRLEKEGSDILAIQADVSNESDVSTEHNHPVSMYIMAENA